MAILGYNEDRDTKAPADTWGDTGKDLVLKGVGGIARGAGEIAQTVGAKEFASGTRDIERAAEERLTPLAKEVDRSSFVPGMGESSSWSHPVRAGLQSAVDLGTTMVPIIAGRIAGGFAGGAAGSVVPGIGTAAGGIAGMTAAGAAQGLGRAEYEARRRVEDMTPEQKRAMPVWNNAYSQSGNESDADEALVTALHPVISDVLNTIAGGASAGIGGAALGRAMGKQASEKIAMGIGSKLFPRFLGGRLKEAGTILPVVGEQVATMGGAAGLEETARQAGEINAGGQQDYEPVQILKATGKGGLTGAAFGVVGGTTEGIRGKTAAGRARGQFDRLYDAAHTLNEGLEGAFPDPAKIPRPTDPVGPVGNAPDPAQEAAAKASTATGGAQGGPYRAGACGRRAGG